MTTRIIMEQIPHLTHLGAILASDDLESLRQACGQGVEYLLGEGTVLAGGLLLPVGGSPGQALLVTRERIERRNYYRPFKLAPKLERELAERAPDPFLLTGEGEIFLDPVEARQAQIPETATRLLVVPLAKGIHFTGALWMALGERPETLEPELSEPLRQFAAAAHHSIRRILRHAELDLQNEQMRRLHELMHRAMIGSERQTLLSMFMSILSRQFRLPRIYIALVQPESGVLRGEVNTGFDHPLRPRQVPAEEGRNRFVAAMLQGEALILEHQPQDHLASFLGEHAQLEPAERGVLLPLVIGVKPLGIIYADQPRHDGTPLYKPVLEIFARLAAAALENLALRKRAELRAETDALTGLRNRFFLDRMLELEIPRVKRYNTPISLLMIDLCDFKRTNDSYGHPFGDYILRETAGLIQANVRAHDVVVRFGGDEFVVLMANTNQEQATLVRQRIEQAFIERNQHQTDERMMISISLGLRSADAQSIDSLIADADQAMYAQKASQKRRALVRALLTDNLDRVETTDRVVGSLCNMLWRKAPYYPEHGRRVAHLAIKVGRALGLTGDDLETLALAGLLHDIGKASLPADILQKPDALTAAELEAMRHHPELGEQFFQGLDHLEPVRPLIRSHHERFDSEICEPYPSYPDGLAGEWIPLGARILRLAELADTMLSHRPYRPAPGIAAAEREINADRGRALDPRLVDILLADPAWHENLGDPTAIEDLLATPANG